MQRCAGANAPKTRIPHIPRTIEALAEKATSIAECVDVHKYVRDLEISVTADWGDETSEGILTVEEICDLLVEMPAQSLTELRLKAAVWRIIAPEELFNDTMLIPPDQTLAVSIMRDLDRLVLAERRNGGAEREAVAANAATG